MNKVKRARIIILVCVFIFLIIVVIKFSLQNKKALNEILPSTYSLTSDDSSLMSENFLTQLKPIEVYRSTVREPISLLAFNEKYHLIIYKIKLENNKSLKDILHTEIKNEDVSNGYSYGTISKDIIYRFRYKAGFTNPASEVYITLKGDSLQNVISNDSIISYHLLADNLSVRYAKDAPIDILIVGEEKALGRTDLVPLDVLFLKDDGNLYLLIMTPNNNKSTIPADLLYNIVTKK